MEGDYDTIFWIKFGVLSLAFGIPIFIMAPGMKWKILFSLGVPVGIFTALSGKSLRRRE